ncbi:hypothetical protein J6590_071732 [Homalodisca vitripennis]|nr:hypothetical protein J6590_071732 [Homalodisca vitripennis]
MGHYLITTTTLDKLSTNDILQTGLVEMILSTILQGLLMFACLDFYLWGRLKDLVYTTRPTTVEDMMQRIRNAVVHACNREANGWGEMSGRPEFKLADVLSEDKAGRQYTGVSTAGDQLVM